MWAELRSPDTSMLKVSFGSLKQSADYKFRLEFFISPSSGQLKPNVTPVLFIFTLRWMKKKPKNNNKHSLRNEKLKANRASETEEQRRES